MQKTLFDLLWWSWRMRIFCQSCHVSISSKSDTWMLLAPKWMEIFYLQLSGQLTKEFTFCAYLYINSVYSFEFLLLLLLLKGLLISQLPFFHLFPNKLNNFDHKAWTQWTTRLLTKSRGKGHRTWLTKDPHSPWPLKQIE